MEFHKIFLSGHEMSLQSEYRFSEDNSERFIWWIFHLRIYLAAIAALFIPALIFGPISKWSMEKAERYSY
jgi:hypothetical protein